MNAPLLRLCGLTKAYPGVVANRDVSFDIGRGEVHALLGENGAGKSTLVKTIYGLVKPDSGTMTLEGAPFAPPNPRAARAAGVAMVFQHFSLFDAMNVAENIALGMENPPPQARNRGTGAHGVGSIRPAAGSRPGSWVNFQRANANGSRSSAALLQDPKLLIMDEPTSVLTPQEVDDPV